MTRAASASVVDMACADAGGKTIRENASLITQLASLDYQMRRWIEASGNLGPSFDAAIFVGESVDA